MKQYGNYHKHDHISNIFTPDSHVKCEDYLKRIKQLGYDCYWTTNHGTGGDIFEARMLCNEYGIKCFFGVEAYIVADAKEKDPRNYHIVIIPKTNKARKKINLITSHASEEGFYYKPRLFLSDLFTLDKDDIYITTACLGGILRDEDAIKEIFVPLVKYFGKNVFLEVQNHNDDAQKTINKRCLRIADKFGLELIAANDSHYIYPSDKEDRVEYLKGKGIDRSDEDTFLLDYPDYDTMYQRFKSQNILSDEQISRALDNTRIFESCEEIYISEDIKMPTAFLGLTPDEKIEELKKHVLGKFKTIKEEEGISGDQLKTYIKGIKEEMQVIIDTKEINTADYFLLNEKIVDLAVNKYNGVLTRTGRGSCGAFYLNRVLGMTQIDRFTCPVKLYPERFISSARLLENRAMPDIDYNVQSQKPFVDAAREVLGDHGVYPMVAYGTMQIGEAFRNVCRSHGMGFDEFNEIGKHIEDYEQDPYWGKYIEEAQKFVDVVVSISPHPCAFCLDNKDLREEYGVVRVGDTLCVMITSKEADYWKVLKDDFLIVSVWGIISDVFKKINKPILTVHQLINSLDDRVWDLYANGITCTLNQVDSDYATGLMRKFKARNPKELTQFIAAIRPSFTAWRDIFIERKEFSSGSKDLDEVLSETRGMVLYQETLMTYFGWLGVTPAESIGIIKKISKKKIKEKDFKELEERLKKNWIKNTGSIEAFDETWDMIQGCMSYGFASPHAYATAIDSLYCAWLKVNYPLEYYSVVFRYYKDDAIRTARLTKELEYFNISLRPIKFRYSTSSPNVDKQSNSIYKGMESIKYVNEEIGNKLYEMRNNDISSFSQMINEFPGNSRQIEVLTKLDFFKEFGGPGELLKIIEVYDKYYGKKQIKKDKINDVIEKYIKTNCDKETEKQYKFENGISISQTQEIATFFENKPWTAFEIVNSQREYLGYIEYKNDSFDPSIYCVFDLITYKGSKTPSQAILYRIKDGTTLTVRLKKKNFNEEDLTKGSFIQLPIVEWLPKKKKNPSTGKWEETDEYYYAISDWNVLRKYLTK